MPLYSVRMSNNHELIVEAPDSSEAYEYALEQHKGHSVTSLAMVPTIRTPGKEEGSDEQ